MTAMPAMPDFASGTQAAEAAAASTGGRFHRLDYLQIGEGESATVRLFTEHTDIVTVSQHFAPTRPAPDGHDGKWPKAMPAVCRNTPAFQQAGTYPDCFLDIKWKETQDDRNYKPRVRSWALGVIRVPLMDNGRQVGMQDSMVEMEVDGNKTMVPEIVILNFAWGNMWANLSTYSAEYGTWCDRDYRITRTGGGTDTEYRPVPFSPATLQGFDHTAVRLQRADLLEKGVPEAELPPPPGDIFDTRNPEHFLKYLAPLHVTEAEFASDYGSSPQAVAKAKIAEVLMERSSDEYFARFFDERMEQPKTKKKGDNEESTSSSAPSSATPPPVVEAPSADADQLDALASRVQSYSGAAVAPPEMATPSS